jgi:hypothetical protein
VPQQPDDPGTYEFDRATARVIERIASRLAGMGDGNIVHKNGNGATKLSWLVISALFVVLTGEFAWFGSSVVSLREERAQDREAIRSLNDKLDMIISGKIVIIKEGNARP